VWSYNSGDGDGATARAPPAAKSPAQDSYSLHPAALEHGAAKSDTPWRTPQLLIRYVLLLAYARMRTYETGRLLLGPHRREQTGKDARLCPASVLAGNAKNASFLSDAVK
jgi:hypothetical protein